MIFLRQANEWTIQSLVRRCWLNALGATVNWVTGGISIGHFVMAITGRHYSLRVCGDRGHPSPRPDAYLRRLAARPAHTLRMPG